MRCKCAEAIRPTSFQAGSNQRPRQWFVLRRNYSCSAFNGYRREWSAFSDVHCRVCGSQWRTKAAFVDELADCEFFPHSTPKVAPL